MAPLYCTKVVIAAVCEIASLIFLFADGIYLMEVDRVLRPGGYWVLSGPPINWKNNYKAWQRPKEELQEEQRKIEEIAKLLCWEKKYEKGEIAIWRKRLNADSCHGRQDDSQATFCKSAEVDDVWYAFVLNKKFQFISVISIHYLIFLQKKKKN
jgi:hypothetical protein